MSFKACLALLLIGLLPRHSLSANSTQPHHVTLTGLEARLTALLNGLSATMQGQGARLLAIEQEQAAQAKALQNATEQLQAVQQHESVLAHELGVALDALRAGWVHLDVPADKYMPEEVRDAMRNQIDEMNREPGAVLFHFLMMSLLVVVAVMACCCCCITVAES